jgi:hypothetical protein
MNIDISKMSPRARKTFVRKHRGFLSRVARELDPPVKPISVFLVLHQRSVSARIKAAIEREMAAILRREAGGR